MNLFGQEIDNAVARGESGATLIAWASETRLFDVEPDSLASIDAAKGEMADRGWEWNTEMRRLEREGWQIWFRSQGTLAPPIAQWSRIPSPLFDMES